MSKIAKKPITLPKDVSLTINKNSLLFKGKLGETNKKIDLSMVNIEQKDGVITIKLSNSDSRHNRAMYGTISRVIQNGVLGVSQGFKKELYMQGVGYKAEVKEDPNMKKKYLALNIGKSYDPRFEIPSDISIEVDKKTTIKISGIDKELVGQTTAIIKSLRKREPYKGRGINTAAEKDLPLKQGKSKSK